MEAISTGERLVEAMECGESLRANLRATSSAVLGATEETASLRDLGAGTAVKMSATGSIWERPTSDLRSARRSRNWRWSSRVEVMKSCMRREAEDCCVWAANQSLVGSQSTWGRRSCCRASLMSLNTEPWLEKVSPCAAGLECCRCTTGTCGYCKASPSTYFLLSDRALVPHHENTSPDPVAARWWKMVRRISATTGCQNLSCAEGVGASEEEGASMEVVVRAALRRRTPWLSMAANH